MKDKLIKECKILFQGDSITFAGRIKFIKSSLGNGYCNIIGKYIGENYGEEITVLNKGIYGDTTTKLKKRWEGDTIKNNPDILSLLIGINDSWRRYDRGLLTTKEKFYENYDYLLKSVKKKNSEIKFIIMSPFLIPINSKQEKWFEDLNPKIEIVKELAEKYDAIYIPLQEIFEEIILGGMDRKELTKDGVHPTTKGHEIIAKAWIQATNI